MVKYFTVIALKVLRTEQIELLPRNSRQDKNLCIGFDSGMWDENKINSLVTNFALW